MDSYATAEGPVTAYSSTADTTADTDTSAPSKKSRPFEKKFEFIVNPGKDSRKLVRTHAMRDFRRRQRQQASQAEHSEHSTSNGTITWQWNTVARRKGRSAKVKHGKSPKRCDLGDGVSECSGTGAVPQEKNSVLRLQKRRGQKQRRRLLPSHRPSVTFDDWEEVPHPQTLLGAGRVDPFRSSSLDLGYTQHESLDHYISLLSHSDFHQPILNSVIQTVISNPASLHAILSLATKASARLRGSPDCLESIWHKGEAIRLTNARLATPSLRYGDAAIHTVAQLAFADHAFGDLASLEIHIAGLETMVSARGGLPALAGNETLQTTLSWIDAAHAVLRRTRLRFGDDLACGSSTYRGMLELSMTTPTSARGVDAGYIVVYKRRYEGMTDSMADLYQDCSVACRVTDPRFVRSSAYLAGRGGSVRTPFGLFYQYVDESVGGSQDAFVGQGRVRRVRGLG
ncbi:MAG: hypothetical protein FRX48_02480 [Lasallia pustulata]|uniref:Uncharacterized protein n=1 Tax=Lasallia pustulata TaxID=136370 RepID=A0A5M8PZM1_9LECA|nr:MAG: hypothetical protein FRX48_02480 [Lasallia pustulata]